MLQIPQNFIHLIHVALRVVVLHAELIAVGLADGAVFIRPRVPHAGAQIVDVVALELPYPQQLVYCGLPVGAAESEYGELLGQVIAVYYSEFFYRVRALAVVPLRAYRAVGVPYAVIKDIAAVLDEYFVCSAHGCVTCFPVDGVSILTCLLGLVNHHRRRCGIHWFGGGAYEIRCHRRRPALRVAMRAA